MKAFPKVTIFALCGIGLWLSAWQEPAQVLATFKGGEITPAEARLWANLTSRKQDDLRDPVLLESLALTMAWYAEAKKQNIFADPVLLDRWHAEEGMMVTVRLRSHLAKSFQFTQADIEAELARGNYTGRPEKIRTRQLFKKYPEGATDAQKQAVFAEVVALSEQVKAGVAFEELAKKESDSQSKHRGGLIGNVGPGDLDPRVEKILFGLKDGELSKPFTTKEGVMVFYCEKRVPALKRSREEQVRKATTNLRARALEKNWQAIVDGYTAKAPITWPKAQGPAQMILNGMTVSPKTLLIRLQNEMDGNVTWENVDRTKAKVLLEYYAVERQMAQRFQALAQTERPEWKELHALAYKTFWGRQVLYKDLDAVFQAPTEAEMKAYFQEHRARFKVKQQFELQFLSWQLTQENIRAKTLAARKVRQSLLKGDITMDQAAQQYSEHPSKQNSGKTGWLPRNLVAAMGKHVLQVVDATEEGQLSPLVRQGQTLYLVKVLGKKPGRPAELVDVKDTIRKKVAEQKLKALQIDAEKVWLERIDLKIASS